LPLAGAVAAVKGNIDVAGLPTTAACPGFGRDPAASATAVRRLEDAGAVVLGTTNLDQFATGLVGTRSPYGAVRDAERPDRISGGSSSGSAVAVALGIVDVALGTDTAGSGRVPAALQGVVGVKPTLGLVPVTGVVPACRSFDCVTAFTRDVALGRRVLAVLAGPDGADATARPWPARAPVAAPVDVRVG
ncbi:amidase family protein, partial [Kineococcus glutinatus]|uniref:amidase family protein n=1 Tax=Kineococcus glutinatus TaxID=1070872 RepID=UPI003CD06080